MIIIAGKILKSKETGEYLAGWDVFGEPKFTKDKELANTMNYPTAKRVAGNLATVFKKGEFEVLPG